MTGRFGNAIDNFLIIMVAVAVVLLLVVMLGSRCLLYTSDAADE